MATAGKDFGEPALARAASIGTSLVRLVPGKFCASFSWHRTGEQSICVRESNAGELSFRTVHGCGFAIISPNDPGAMVQYAEECRTLGIPFIFDPGQQCARMSGDELRNGVTGAAIVIVNDYELELLRQKTNLTEADILTLSQVLIVTRGEHGSSVITRNGRIDVPAVTPHRIVDPTGVGDAYRGGLLRGIGLGLPHHISAQMGSVAAAYALEHLGGLSHAYTWDEFRKRYEEHFGTLALPAQ
jgi:adenosine kinase